MQNSSWFILGFSIFSQPQNNNYRIKNDCRNLWFLCTWWNSEIQRRRHELLSLPDCLQHQEQRSGDHLLAGPKKIQCKPLKPSHLKTKKQRKQCVLVICVSPVVTIW